MKMTYKVLEEEVCDGKDIVLETMRFHDSWQLLFRLRLNKSALYFTGSRKKSHNYIVKNNRIIIYYYSPRRLITVNLNIQPNNFTIFVQHKL